MGRNPLESNYEKEILENQVMNTFCSLSFNEKTPWIVGNKF